MHVHGNHLNLNAPVEISTARSVASQRAADVRRKLLKEGAAVAEEAEGEEAFVETLQVELEPDDGSGRRRRQHTPSNNFQAADASEDEAAVETRTSLWA